MKNELIQLKFEKLQTILKELKQVIVAFSGGVDSSFLAKVAYDVLGKNTIAITIDAPQLSKNELFEAQSIAKNIGIQHFIIPSELVSTEWFKTNPKNRCYICKKGSLELITQFCEEKKIKGQLLEGSNFDDLDDYRPGFKAVKEKSVLSPLVAAELTKQEIRILAKELQLDCWDKPASPCLATRIPIGEEVTSEKLEMISQSEEFIKSLGFRDIRVRLHSNIARIESDQKDIPKLLANAAKIANKLKSLGFIFVTIDLEGYKKGSMN
jgi:uncharacterized protein